MKTKLILIVLLVVVCMILVLQNTDVVSFRFFFWQFGISRIILIPVFVLVGFMIGYIVGERQKKRS